MVATHVLENIPKEIQKRYNIDEKVEVEVDNSVMGGHFTLFNKTGKEISIDAVELFGCDNMTIKRLARE